MGTGMAAGHHGSSAPRSWSATAAARPGRKRRREAGRQPMRYLVFCFLLAGFCRPLLADGGSDTAAKSGPAAPASYVFVPGDVIDITVPTHMGYDRTLTIQPDGRIEFPSVGEIVAAGLTSAQLAPRIQEG